LRSAATAPATHHRTNPLVRPQAVDRLRKRFSIGRVCIVADRGMISAEIAQLEARGLFYILGVRERSDKLIRDLVLDDLAPLLTWRTVGGSAMPVAASARLRAGRVASAAGKRWRPLGRSAAEITGALAPALLNPSMIASSRP
jgi:hypothetical protein